jgi:hypothetical protein
MRRPQATADAGLVAHVGSSGFIPGWRVAGWHTRTPYVTEAPLLLARG